MQLIYLSNCLLVYERRKEIEVDCIVMATGFEVRCDSASYLASSVGRTEDISS